MIPRPEFSIFHFFDGEKGVVYLGGMTIYIAYIYVHEGNGILTEHIVSCFPFYGFSVQLRLVVSGCMSSLVREGVAADSTPALD